MIQIIEWNFTRLKNTAITIVNGGNIYLAKVPFFPWGFVSKVLAQQASGTSVNFTVDVLNSNLGLTPGELQPSQLPPGWQMTRVINTLNGPTGQQASLFLGYGQPYRNQDGPDPIRTGQSLAATSAGQTAYTNAQRYLYVLLQPDGNPGNNSVWEVTVSGWINLK
jgi:hypothetical protein